jgi:hypothetical protein
VRARNRVFVSGLSRLAGLEASLSENACSWDSSGFKWMLAKRDDDSLSKETHIDSIGLAFSLELSVLVSPWARWSLLSEHVWAEFYCFTFKWCWAMITWCNCIEYWWCLWFRYDNEVIMMINKWWWIFFLTKNDDES